MLSFKNIFIKLPKNVRYRHLFIWMLFTLYVFYAKAVDGGGFLTEIIYLFLFVSNFAISYYLLLLIIFPRFLGKNNLVFILLFIAIFVFFVSWDYIHLKLIIPFLGGVSARGDMLLYDFVKSSILLFSFSTFSALGSYLNWKSLEQFKEVTEKEKRTLSSELGYLKNQFNSHLTFNFLNFCYSKMLQYSPKNAESVEYFSEMLHYSLSINSNEFVNLSKEVEYLDNFINIQKCLSENVYVDFSIEGEIDKFKIMPMVLAVFVENSFKHGIFNDFNNPIKIKLIASDNDLFFSIQNLKKNHKTTIKTGIGLENIKQSLDLFYSNNYSLEINETEALYKTEFTLKISKYL